MSGKGVLLLGLSLGFLLLPFLPGLRELLRPRDDRPLDVDRTFTRDPRYFGLAFRRKLEPFLAEVGTEPPYLLEVVLRRPETLAVHADLRVPDGVHESAILVALGDADLGTDAHVEELYVRGQARLAPGARVRALACDGGIELADGCRVERWIDAAGHLLAGSGCDLGFSASAGGVLRLGPGCGFTRLWGRPIAVQDGDATMPAPGPGREPEEPARIEDEVVWGENRLTLPRGFVLDRDLVSHTEVRVGAGSLILGTIKAHGPIHVGEGARVKGNLISRKGIAIEGGARIRGDVFAEGDLRIGPGTQIGRKGTTKTAYAAGTVRLSPGVLVLGWLIAESGGLVETGEGA